MANKIEFFARSKTGEFLPLGIYSAKSWMGKAFGAEDHSTGLVDIDLERLRDARRWLQNSETKQWAQLTPLEDRINELMDNREQPIGECVEEICRLRELKDTIHDDIESIRSTIHQVAFLIGIVSAAHYADEYDDEEYLYIGYDVDSSAPDANKN